MLSCQCLRILAQRSLLTWVLLLALIPMPVTLRADSAVEKLTWADKMLSEQKYDFGSPAVGAVATHVIQITNLYKETVTISEVTSSDSEFKARVDKSNLNSKDVAQLELSLDPAVARTAKLASVSLKMTFDGVNYKTVTVPVSAFVEPGQALNPAMVNKLGQNWAEQMFSDLTYDFGPVARGAEAKHVIEITNSYKQIVTLSNPVSSCQCITPQLDISVLNSRQVARLTLNLDTVRFSKKRDVTVTLDASFANGGVKQIRIPITAYIRQDVVLDPGSVQFGIVAPGEVAERRVRVLYAGRANWTVRPEVRVGNSHLKAEVQEVLRQNGRVEYELLVKLDGDAPKGRVIDQLVLVTDDAANPTIPILVDGTVEADLQITPELVQFGPLKPGVPKVVKVVVKGRKPFRIEKVECDSARECYGVSIPSVDQSVHIVSLTITPPDEPGELKEAFTVTIAGRTATLAFQAIGMIEATVNPAAEEPVPEAQDRVPADAVTAPLPKP